MSSKPLSNIIGFDDSPFPHGHRGSVKVVGAVFADLRFDGVLIGEVQADGSDAARQLSKLVAESKFAPHTQLIMLQGIALGGFNVVDVFELNERLGLPVLVVSRIIPDMKAIREALTTRVPEGLKKWDLIDRLGPMESAGHVYIQRVGMTLEQAVAVVDRFSVHSQIPEPIRPRT